MAYSAPQGSLIGGVQIVAGVLLSVASAGSVGAGLIISGVATLLGGAIAHKPVGGKGGFSTSGTYGFDRAQNAAFEGAPKFFVLGEERIAPSYVNAFTQRKNQGQELWMQFFCGTGGEYGIESISDIEINGEPISNYKHVEASYRYGTSTQSIMPGFSKTAWQYNKEVKLKTTEKWYYDTVQEVDEVVFVIKFPAGLYKIQDEEATWDQQLFSIKAKAEGDDGWTRIFPPKVDDDDPLIWSSYGDWQYWMIAERSTSSFDRLMSIRLGTNYNKNWKSKSKFTIRIQAIEKSSSKHFRTAWVSRAEEIVYDTDAYAGNALLGLRMKATEQLAYDFPHVTCVVKDWKVLDPRTSTVAWSQNPALLTRAMLLDSTDGAGDWITSSDLWDGAGEDWRTVADRCDAMAASSGDHKQERWKLDIVVDSIQDAKDWLDHILGTFRASIVEYGGKLGIVQDVAGSAVATFDGRQSPTAGRRPIIAMPDGRASLNWNEFDTDQRANIVSAYYTDSESEYERAKTEEIKDTVRLAAGDPEVRKEVYMPGVTRQAQAVRQSRYVLNSDRLTSFAGQMNDGIGDNDLLPEDKIVIYADSPKEFATGVTVRVIGVGYDRTNTGTVYFRKYNAGTYDDTSDTLPATPTWVSRATALANAAAAAPSASNVTLIESDS